MTDEEATPIIKTALVRLGALEPGEAPSTSYFLYVKSELDGIIGGLHVNLAEHLKTAPRISGRRPTYRPTQFERIESQPLPTYLL